MPHSVRNKVWKWRLVAASVPLGQLTSFLIHQNWCGETVGQIQVTALDPSEQGMQMDLFLQINSKREMLYSAVDEINNEYGEFTIAPASMLNKSEMPNVIAPAWKPYGHRQTI